MDRSPVSPRLPVRRGVAANTLQLLSDESSERVEGSDGRILTGDDAKTLHFGYSDISPGDNASIQQSANATPSSGPREERPKRGRKGHSKSRTGCFNCKRARIKCKENRPACDYCAHRGLHCQWPGLRTEPNQIIEGSSSIVRNSPPAPRWMDAVSVPASPKMQGPVFTAQDFRLFDYFVKSCYPHFPVGNDSTWTHVIPCIASDHPFLLHSILALSASELSNRDPSNSPSTSLSLRTTAMTHRLAAISALNAAVSAGLKTYEQGNAMLATCFALLFQSTLINDGLGEYMSFIRGTTTIGIQMYVNNFKILFSKVFGDENMEELDPKLQQAPLIESSVVVSAIRSLERIAPLCQTKVEREMYGLLLSMARNLITSSRDAYLELRKIYALFSYHMPYSEFREFTDPGNEVCQLLQAHFVAMQLVMGPIFKVEWTEREPPPEPDHQNKHNQTGHWLINIHAHIPAHMRRYYEWTLWVEEEVYRKERIFNGKYEGVGGFEKVGEGVG